jgi:type IX secretion system PorP/SprF family membrane protein
MNFLLNISITNRLDDSVKSFVRSCFSFNSIYFLIILFLFSSFSAFSQIEAMYSLYKLNPQYLTPVQAGSLPNSEIIVSNRQQWVGFDGAPKTLGVTSNIKWKYNKGLGFLAYQDQAGPMTVTNLAADFAYHIRLDTNWTLTGGIRGGFLNLALDFSRVDLVHQGDDLFAKNRSTGFNPNVGWGVKIAKGDGFFFSLSQPRLLKYEFSGNGAFKDVVYAFAQMGTKIRINEQINLYPSTLFRFGKDIPLSFDANVNANLSKKLDVGLSYRYLDSYGIRLGLQVTEGIYLGYVFENPISQISKISTQTHEFAIRFSIKPKKRLDEYEKENELLNKQRLDKIE